jgi:DNA-binding MarR family transcriptional regulator
LTSIKDDQRRAGQTSPVAVAELYEHLVRAVHTASFTLGLNPAQWNALRYLNSAAASGRSVKAFAQFHMVSTSTASQTLSALVRKQLVEKRRDASDGRGVVLTLTAKGRDLLARDPLHVLAQAFAMLDEETRATAAQIGAEVARNMFLAKSAKTTTKPSPEHTADEQKDPHHR